jgi:hypothetical protein
VPIRSPRRPLEGNAVEGLDDYVVERSLCATVFVQPHLVSIFR